MDFVLTGDRHASKKEKTLLPLLTTKGYLTTSWKSMPSRCPQCMYKITPLRLGVVNGWWGWQPELPGPGKGWGEVRPPPERGVKMFELAQTNIFTPERKKGGGGTHVLRGLERRCCPFPLSFPLGGMVVALVGMFPKDQMFCHVAPRNTFFLKKTQSFGAYHMQ